jgi:hypothetical protein
MGVKKGDNKVSKRFNSQRFLSLNMGYMEIGGVSAWATPKIKGFNSDRE